VYNMDAPYLKTWFPRTLLERVIRAKQTFPI
jgi:hypothetical protein